MVLTKQKDTSFYDQLNLEGNPGSPEVLRQNAQWEDKTGASINVTSTRVARPGNFGTSGSNGSYVILARKSTGAIGAAKLLKVMAGDRLHTQVESFYTVANANNSGASGINSLVANFASAIAASSQVGSALKDGASSIASGLSGVTALVNLLNTANNTSGGNNAPKAYLNVLFLSERFVLRRAVQVRRQRQPGQADTLRTKCETAKRPDRQRRCRSQKEWLCVHLCQQRER